MTRSRPRSMNGALADWPDALAACVTEPTTVNLDALCSLLDVIDADIVRKWGSEGHLSRLETLRDCRRSARRASSLVAAAQLERAQARGQRASDAKRERSAA